MADTFDGRALVHAGEETLAFAVRPPALESPMGRATFGRRFSEPQGALASPLYGPGSPLVRRPDASFYSASSPQRTSSPVRPASCGPLLARIPLAAISVIAADGKLHQAPAPDASGTVAVGRAAIECSRERPDDADNPSLAYSKKPRATSFTPKSVSDWQERKQRDAVLLKGILSPSSAWKGAPGSAGGPGGPSSHSAGGSRGLSRHRSLDGDGASEYSRDRGYGGGYDDVPPVSAGAGDRVFFRSSLRSGGGPDGGGVSGAASVVSAGRSSVGSTSPRRFASFGGPGSAGGSAVSPAASYAFSGGRSASGRYHAGVDTAGAASHVASGAAGADALDGFNGYSGFSPSSAGGSSIAGGSAVETWRSSTHASGGPVPPPPRSTGSGSAGPVAGAGGHGGARSRSMTAEIANEEAAAMRAARRSVYTGTASGDSSGYRDGYEGKVGEGKAGEGKNESDSTHGDAAASAREALAGRAATAQRRFLVSPMGMPRPESVTGDAMRTSAPPSRSSSAAGPLLTGGRSGYASQQRYSSSGAAAGGAAAAAASEYDETAPAPVAAPALPAPILAPSPTRARAVGGAGGSFRAPQASSITGSIEGAGAPVGPGGSGSGGSGTGSLLNVVPADVGYAAAASRRLGAHATRSMRLSSGQGIVDGYDDTSVPSVLSPAKQGAGSLSGTLPLTAVPVDASASGLALSSPPKAAVRSQLATSGAAVARQESGRFDAVAGGSSAGVASGGSPRPPQTPASASGSYGAATDLEVLIATMGTRPRGYADAHSRSVHLQATNPGPVAGAGALAGALSGPPVSPLTAGGHAAVSPPSRGTGMTRWPQPTPNRLSTD